MGRGTGLSADMRELLRRGGIILTGNARAARALYLRYAEVMQAEGATAWPAPQILDLHSWLTEQWKFLLLTGTEDRLLLNDLQERVLWERIIGPAIENFSLVEPARLAELAHQAYGLLANYRGLGRLNESLWMVDPHAEPEVFHQWARSFQQECERRHWLPRCELIDAVTHAFQWGTLTPPQEIGWIGFDRETPAEQALRAALETRDASQQDLSWDIEQTPPSLYTAQDEHEENIACAEWTRARLTSHPDSRIGILMPDLASRRPQLERDLYRILIPDRFPITAGTAPSLPFEFSLGQPLAQVPLVHAALLLLRWLHTPLMQQELSWLLLSSTLGAAQSESARAAMAQLDAMLRNTRCAPPELTLESFLRQPQHGIPIVSALYRDLTSMLEQHRRSSQRAGAGEWLRRISWLLRTAQWGARSDGSSLLYQAREAWERMLEQIASLDFTTAPLLYKEFLAILERTAQETIFAAETENAPVQVMGAYAASGQSFDAVWFLGATDAGWPAAGRPNPLLPISLQRELGMPHASAADNTALAHRVMARIAENSGEVVYSYAQISGESIQRPSSLVSSFAPAKMAFTPATQRAISLDPVADDTWVPLPPGAAPSGGQTALKRQAECPFQAFVFHRLNVQELPIAGRGLSPADRGSLVHAVMERIWSKEIGDYQHLTSHADLLHAIATDTLRPFVARHTAAAMRKLDMPSEDPWQRAYLKAEEERTINLVMDWLEMESKRQPFQVAQVEQKDTIVVGELTLKVRADRIDEVPAGKLLIDYKTGEVSTASWDGPRPEQPQLPLYAAFGHTDNLVGAVFAQMRRPTLAFKGRVDDPHKNLSDKLDTRKSLRTEPFTPDLIEQWRSTLVDLSTSFVRGEAQVDPHIYPKSCQYCPLSGVCRVTELRGTAALPDISDEEDSE